jgi:hypothetical protein
VPGSRPDLLFGWRRCGCLAIRSAGRPQVFGHPPVVPVWSARAYADRRAKEGLPEKEIIRCLKRYVAREVYPHLRPPAG